MSLWSRLERRLEEIAGELLPDDTRDSVTTAREALARGDARAAAEILGAVVTARPAYAGGLSLLGAAQLQLGAFDAAIGAFDAAIALHDDFAEAHVGRGHALLGLDRADEAVPALRRAIDAAAGDEAVLADAYRGLGKAYLARGDRDKAIRELRKAVAEAPDDAEARTELGGALLGGSPAEAALAREHLSRAAAAADAPPRAHLLFARAELASGHTNQAEVSFRKALEAEPGTAASADALAGIGDAALARGELAAARAHYLHALELGPRRPELHARLADALRAQGDADTALASYERAASLGADVETLRRSLATALACGPTAAPRAVDLANRLLAHDPEDPRAVAARALQLAQTGQHEAARATLLGALDGRDELELHLALGHVEHAAGNPRAAAEQAWASLRLAPREPRARALLENARAAELAVNAEGGDDSANAEGEPLYRLARDLQRVVGSRRELAELVHDVAQTSADFDQPLLVTVMGEFSSGKSTFINAVVRDEIAPVGITPTTATINVVKYGRERSGRVVYRDGRVLPLPWPALSATLHALDGDAARDVATVEILYPLAELERVNIVDTPGLNSILPEHEEVARDFIARADAIVWLFAAGQAGKASERDALDAIRREGKRVLGVLNKTDQLTDSECEQLLAHVRGELGERVEVVVPLSARQALAGRRESSDTDAGNWRELAATLEDRFFSRARELKRQACAHRLAGLLADARGRVQDRAARAAEASRALERAADELRNRARAVAEEVVAHHRRGLAEGMAHLYRAAAREVLDLVRPRRLPFGSHRATPSDRDYLLGLLDAGFAALLAPVRDAVLADIRAVAGEAAQVAAREAAVIGEDHAAAVEQAGREAAELVDARVFARAEAFVRGYLRGGCVDRFFRRDLPKLELTEDATYHALYREAPDLDAEIAEPLGADVAAALYGLAERIERLAGLADALAFDIEVGVGRALAELDRRRAGLSGAGLATVGADP